MGVDVDEAGRDGHVPGVDLGGARGGDLADRADAVAGDGHVAGARVRSRAVDEGAAADDEVGAGAGAAAGAAAAVEGAARVAGSRDGGRRGPRPEAREPR